LVGRTSDRQLLDTYPIGYRRGRGFASSHRLSDHGAGNNRPLEVRSTGLLGPTGSIGNADDNSMAEGLSGAFRLEMLDRRRCQTRHELALAVFSQLANTRPVGRWGL
jgi:hypothetical protein